jgi:HEPN domain-containing protein
LARCQKSIYVIGVRIDIARFNCWSVVVIIGILRAAKNTRDLYMDVQKQIDFWKGGADEDFAAAEALLEKGHLRHCLFFAHLAVEKMLKAHVTKQTEDIPPRIHNLIRLAEIAEMSLSPEQASLLRSFGAYQLEGRYPDSEQVLLELQAVRRKLVSAKEMLKWLKAQL